MPVPLFNQVGTEKCDVALWWKLAWKPNIKFLLPPPKLQRRWLVFLVKCVTAYIRLWLVILWLWWVMLLIWLLLRSLVGYCCACGLLMWLCCCAIGDIHTGVKSGCKLVTLLSFLWYDKLWGPSQRVVTLFDSVNQALGNASIYWCSQPSMSFFIARKSPVLRLHISCQSNYLSLPCSFLLYFLSCCQPIWFCFETDSSSLTKNLHTEIHHKMVW